MFWSGLPKLLIFYIFLAVNIISFSQGTFNFKPYSIACDTFPPPRNLSGVSYDNMMHIWWELPELSGGIVPDNLVVYKVYRNGTLLDSLLNVEDTTHYYDYVSLSVYPTDHEYWVVAVYDLSECGFPGMYTESMTSDTLSFWIYYYLIFTFLEDWSTGSFGLNLWSAGE